MSLEDFKRRIQKIKEAKKWGRADIWEEDWELTRARKRRHCPDDESIAAYSEGLAKRSPGWFWRMIRIWWHIRGCVLCRIEQSILRDVMREHEGKRRPGGQSA